MLKYIANGKLVLASKDGGAHIKSSKYTAVFTGHDSNHRTGVAVCAGRVVVCVGRVAVFAGRVAVCAGGVAVCAGRVAVCAGRGTVCQKPTLGIPMENPT